MEDYSEMLPTGFGTMEAAVELIQGQDLQLVLHCPQQPFIMLGQKVHATLQFVLPRSLQLIFL